MEQNQCDGCMRGLPTNNYGHHIDIAPGGIFGCTKHLYITETNGEYIAMNIGCVKEE